MMASDLSTLAASVSEAVVIWDYESFNIPANANASSTLNGIQTALQNMVRSEVHIAASYIVLSSQRFSDPIVEDFCNAGSLFIYYNDEDQMNTLLNNFCQSFTNLHKRSDIKPIIVVISGDEIFGSRLASMKDDGFSFYGFYNNESEVLMKENFDGCCAWSQFEQTGQDDDSVNAESNDQLIGNENHAEDNDTSMTIGTLANNNSTTAAVEANIGDNGTIIPIDAKLEEKTKNPKPQKKKSSVPKQFFYTNDPSTSSSVTSSFFCFEGDVFVPIYPTGLPKKYGFFSIDPLLPKGLLLNPRTGMILGWPSCNTISTQYIITLNAKSEYSNNNKIGYSHLTIEIGPKPAGPVVEAKQESYENSYLVVREIFSGSIKLQADVASVAKEISIQVSCGAGHHFETKKDISNDDIGPLKARLQLKGITATYRQKINNKLRIHLDDHLWKWYNELSDRRIMSRIKHEAFKAITDHIEKALSDIVTPALAEYVNDIAKLYLGDYSNSGKGGLKKFLNGIALKKVMEGNADTCSPEKVADSTEICRFHLLDRYEQLSSVFLQLQNHYPILEWDFSTLNQFVQNFCVFSDDVRKISEKVANYRNWVAHDNYDEKFIDSFDQMEELLNLLVSDNMTPELLDKMLLQLKDHETRFKAFYPAKNSIEDFERTESRLKVLTDDQWKLVKSLNDLSVGSRQLIEAPAGSGKTLIAIKLCVSRFTKRRDCRILLLTHSKPLVDTVLIPGVQEELELNGCNVEPIGGVFKSLSKSRELHVTTIDDLITSKIDASNECKYIDLQAAFSSADKFDLIVIDEGHHVFSRQDNKDLHGHHVFSRQSDWFLEGQHHLPKEWVKDVINWLLRPEYCQLVIFRDSNQAPKGDNGPSYPDIDVKKDWIRHIIRNPGHVRDALVPLYSRICKDEYDASGLVSFFPLRDKRVIGPPIRTYLARTTTDCSELLSKCLDDLLGQYGESSFSQTINGKVVSTIAILISSDYCRLIDDNISVSDYSQMDFVRNMISNSTTNACETERMYLGPFENFAGLERPIIIVIRDHDSTAYSCFSRCTFQLSVISLGNFEHYNLCEAEIGGEVSHSGNTGKFICLLSDSEAFIPLEIDLSKPLPMSYENAMGMRLINITPSTVFNPSFDFLRNCKKLKSLALSFGIDINTSNEHKYVLIDGIFGILAVSCKNLFLLNVSNNQLTTLPASIGGLTSLTQLYVSNNQLTSLPDSIGGLVSLKYLDVSYNQLTTVPNSIGGLASLIELYVSSNQLRTLQNWIVGLTSLNCLLVSGNIDIKIPQVLLEMKRLVVYRMVNTVSPVTTIRVQDSSTFYRHRYSLKKMS